jgi:hypothetical protein
MADRGCGARASQSLTMIESLEPGAIRRDEGASLIGAHAPCPQRSSQTKIVQNKKDQLSLAQ